MKVSEILSCLLAAYVTSGCSLIDSTKALELSRLQMERAALVGLKSQLATATPGDSEVYVVIRDTTINQVLAGAMANGGFQMPVPGRPSATVTLTQLAYLPVDGMGQLAIAATAEDAKSHAKLDVSILAQLVPDFANSRLHVRVDKVAVQFSWKCARWSVLGLAKAVVTAEADKWALNTLSWSMQLSQKLAFELPKFSQGGVQIPTRNNGSYLVATLNREEGVAFERRITLSRYWFLRDGIHLFGKVEPVL